MDEFYDRVLADERVDHCFADTDVTALRAHQVRFISAVTGGPVEYTGVDMRGAHGGTGITDGEFDVVADHLDARWPRPAPRGWIASGCWRRSRASDPISSRRSRPDAAHSNGSTSSTVSARSGPTPTA